MIIGFAGKKGSGKTTAAKFLVEAGWARYSFADPMRTMLVGLLSNLGFSPEERRRIFEQKETVIEPIGVSLRQLMQTLGTEWGRNLIDPDLWIKCQRYRLTERHSWHIENVVYDDIRFENEAALIRECGGKIVHICRPDLDDADTHASEAGIAQLPGDIRLINDGNLTDLLDSALALADGVEVLEVSNDG